MCGLKTMAIKYPQYSTFTIYHAHEYGVKCTYVYCFPELYFAFNMSYTDMSNELLNGTF